jgi:hypothetical protein
MNMMLGAGLLALGNTQALPVKAADLINKCQQKGMHRASHLIHASCVADD